MRTLRLKAARSLRRNDEAASLARAADETGACEAFNGPIKRVSSTGTVTDWVTLATTYLRFGPGGAWGTGLYATDFASFGNNRIVKVSSAGAITPFVSGITFAEGFDWGFDGDLFATDPSAGLVLRIKSDGTKTTFATLGGAADVAYRPGEHALYVVSNQGGLYRVVRAGTTAVPVASPLVHQLTVAPNPTGGFCTLRFGLARGGLTRAQVVDATGRTVRTLATAWRPAGEQSLTWDGRDAGGSAAAPGVYFARVSTAEATQTARLTLVR
jgi:FlgD Ig-like domain